MLFDGNVNMNCIKEVNQSYFNAAIKALHCNHMKRMLIFVNVGRENVVNF